MAVEHQNSKLVVATAWSAILPAALLAGWSVLDIIRTDRVAAEDLLELMAWVATAALGAALLRGREWARRGLVVVLFVVSLVYATVLVVVAIFVRADPSFLEFSLRNPELAYLRRDAAVALGAVFAIALWSGVLWTLLASRAFKGQFASD